MRTAVNMSEKSKKAVPTKYSGYALIQKIFIGRKKLKHGKGIMYFANGDQLNGEWYNDQCKRGTYKFANGDVFEGEISMIYTQRGMMGPGTMVFASEGDITLNIRHGTTRLIVVLPEQSKIKSLIQVLLIVH